MWSFERTGHIFNARTIDVIENEARESMVDVIGVVETVLPTNIITRKDGRETEKRSLTIKDTSGKSVEVTLWGSFCNREGQRLQDSLDNGQHPVLAVKGGRTSDFSGRTIGTISTSQLSIDPDIVEAHRYGVGCVTCAPGVQKFVGCS